MKTIVRWITGLACMLALSQGVLAGEPCGAGTFNPPPAEGFERKRYRVFLRDVSPNHMAQDVMVVPGETITLRGKFSYGDVGKDLEESRVHVYLHDCREWRKVADAETDDDGRISVDLDVDLLPDVGKYTVAQLVVGDGSFVESQITVAEPGTRLVLFDIDGTLTTGNDEVVEDFLFDDTPSAHAGAVALTQEWQKRGVEIVYMTGRPYYLMGITRAWLRDTGFAEGTIRTTDRKRDALPSEKRVGEFKRGVLDELTTKGLLIEAAYGNADTDVWAYTKAGVDPRRVFIIGKHGGEEGTVAVTSWLDHIDWLRTQPTPLE